MKNTHRFISLILLISLTASMLLSTGCANQGTKTVVLTIYDENSAKGGYLAGWFADEIRDRFHIQLQYENANSAGFTAYVEANNIGDIIIFNSMEHYRLARDAGRLLNWEDENFLEEYAPGLKEAQADSLAKNQKENGGSGIYGIYANQVAGNELTSNPAAIYLNYTYYKEIGCPAIPDLDTLAEVLSRMTEAAQKDHEKTVYAISTTSTDEEVMPTVVKDLLAVYGYESFGLGIYNPATNTYEDCIKEDGLYAKLLSFYQKLNDTKLLDPAYVYQDSESSEKKYQSGLAIMSFEERPGFLPVQLGEATPNTYLQDPAGSGSIFSIAENCAYPDYAIAFIEWLYTPEGYLTYLYGPQDVCWTYDAQGYPMLTKFGYQCLMEDYVVMSGKYSGYFADGDSGLLTDTWMLHSPIPHLNVDTTFYFLDWPDSKSNGWASHIASLETQNWQKDLGVESTSEYLKSFSVHKVPASSYVMSTKEFEVDLPYSQIRAVINVYSWGAIQSPDMPTFQDQLRTMNSEAHRYRYDLVEDFLMEELDTYRASLGY